MLARNKILLIGAMALFPLLASAPSSAAPLSAANAGYGNHIEGNVEQVARRCRYDRRGRLRCRGVRYRAYRPYYYDPYTFYGFYPRYWGYGHHHHHGFGHGHGGFGHGHHGHH